LVFLVFLHCLYVFFIDPLEKGLEVLFDFLFFGSQGFRVFFGPLLLLVVDIDQTFLPASELLENFHMRGVGANIIQQRATLDAVEHRILIKK